MNPNRNCNFKRKAALPLISDHLNYFGFFLAFFSALFQMSTQAQFCSPHGQFVIWGSETTPYSNRSGFSAIAAAYDHALAIQVDTTVVAWGHNGFRQSSV